MNWSREAIPGSYAKTDKITVFLRMSWDPGEAISREWQKLRHGRCHTLLDCGSALVIQTAQQRPSRDKCKMQPERTVVLIRETWMRSVGVQHLEQPIDVVLAVNSPLVPVLRQKSSLGQERATVLG
jgi:hypothetical protein